MSFSIQTNVNSLQAQENLRMSGDFQSRTIQRLTSGYRINSSADDAAGLAVANKFRSDTAELTQGVRNANDGLSQLQIIDGGLNNISKSLDRLKTLATQSASGTFTGDRKTLDNEYQSLLSEIDREASNIGLNASGTFNRNISIYTGGGSNQNNAQVSVDLSGSTNQVDTQGLGLKGSTVTGGGTTLTGNTTRLDNVASTFLTGGTQDLTFQSYDSATNSAKTTTVTVDGGAAGLTGQQYVDKLNDALKQAGLSGVSASISTASGTLGQLQLASASPFSVSVAAGTGGTDGIDASSAGVNAAAYSATQATSAGVTAGTESLTFANGTGTVQVSLNSTNTGTLDATIQAINNKTSAIGIYAIKDSTGSGFSLQSATSFSALKTAAATTGSVFSGAVGTQTVTAPSSGGNAGDNALSAITKITQAVQNLGQIQGRLGTGQNRLQSAITLAQSQIGNFSAAESRIRDADVAAEAANLTKAQVLQQANMAAMAQANSGPQSIMALLRG